jgi:hypothetical protein
MKLSLVLLSPLVAIALLLQAFTAFAEANLSGTWGGTYTEDWPDRFPGPELGDFAGLPINSADRLRAESWSASLIAMSEYQCRVHPADYANSFADIRFWEQRDPWSEELIALHLQHFAWQTRRTIWMDGREHPSSNHQHTSMGYSTGKWHGDTLIVTTTHLQEGWLRRNGVARSDQAVMTEHFTRHGNILTWTVMIDDPIYLEETFVRNRDYRLQGNVQLGSYPCIPVVEMVREEGEIPHHLPAANEDWKIFSQRHGIPFEAAMGGAHTMYPEYMKEIERLKAEQAE